jgi:TatD DNase family protein
LIIDTHAHLDMAPFSADRAEVISRARQTGVARIITIGIDLASSNEAIRLAESYAGVWATVGIHPQHAAGVSETDIKSLASLARHPRVVALGEMGLDFFRDYSPRDTQLMVLACQLELARKLGLAVVIHCRRAEKEMIPILRAWTASLPGPRAGVIHCFSGDEVTLRHYLDMGFYISLGAYIGYPSSSGLRAAIRAIPADRLLLETDAPYLPPQSRRGKRNEPAYVTETLRWLAEIRGVSQEELGRETTNNAVELFRLS